MSTRYKVVHFVPDPFTGGRIPIAVLASVKGRIHAVEVVTDCERVLPHTARLAVAAIREALESTATLSELPASVGPHATLGEERQVPAGVENAVEWIRTAVFHMAPGDRGVPKTERRRVIGQRFIREHQLELFVKRGYRAEPEVGHFAQVLPEVSQYVRGGSRLLLLEPLVPAESQQFTKSLQTVGTTFLAWRQALGMMKHDDAEFIAYVLPDGGTRCVAEARSVLEGSADRVLDVSSELDLAAFLSTVREAGRSLLPSWTA